jgi:acyl-CoA thioesterase
MIATEYAELAERFDRAGYSRHMGMQLVELSRGSARVTMQLTGDHVNWQGFVHGGVIMSLADQAFGCATNTLDPIFVAVQFSISLMAAPAVGDTLTAEARVLHAGRTTGVAEMSVTDGRGRLVAKATGTVVAVGDRK